MLVNQITIRREGYLGGGSYTPSRGDPSKPFNATIEVEGQTGKVELKLGHEMSAKIVAVIAEEVAAAGRATAEAMVASMMLPIEAEPAQIEHSE